MAEVLVELFAHADYSTGGATTRMYKEVLLSILQVNVRPAVTFRKSDNSQRRENAGGISMNQKTEFPVEQTPGTSQLSEPIARHPQNTLRQAARQQQSSVTLSEQQRSSLRSVEAQAASLHTKEHHEPVAAATLNEEHFAAEAVQTNHRGVATEAMVEPPPSIWQNVVWKLMPATTVGRALNSARGRLDEAGCSTASLDAQVILAHVLGVDRSWLFAHHEYKLNPEQADAFTKLIVRRTNHEPVAYLIGRKEFYGLEFLVDRRVLIPRPETELLVDAVLDHATEQGPVVVADVGTGSGAISLAIANHCEDARIYAIDLSLDALEVAKRNVERLDSRGQVTLAQGDLLTPLPEKVHVVVANLPYISNDLYSELDADVREFEPQVALEAGPEGLDAIHRLLQQVHYYLLPDGIVFLEIGHDQGPAVRSLAQACFPHAQHIAVRRDYHGHDRLVTIIP